MRNVSVRLSPDEMQVLNDLARHYQGGDEVRRVSLGEAGRRAILAEAKRVGRRGKPR